VELGKGWLADINQISIAIKEITPLITDVAKEVRAALVQTRPSRGDDEECNRSIGIELAEKVKKGQFKTGKLGGRNSTMTELWNVALAAWAIRNHSTRRSLTDFPVGLSLHQSLQEENRVLREQSCGKRLRLQDGRPGPCRLFGRGRDQPHAGSPERGYKPGIPLLKALWLMRNGTYRTN